MSGKILLFGWVCPKTQLDFLFLVFHAQYSYILLIQDYGIQDGSTIKLVLSMRGGPLGTARRVVPLDDVVVKEFVELDR